MSKVHLEIPPGLKRWWLLWKVPTVAAILLLLAWSVRGPVLGFAAGWRAERTATKAQELAAAGQWRQAEAEARRALQLDRSDHTALGVLMESSLRNGNVDTLRVAASFFGHPESSAADKAKVLELLLLSRDYIGFRRLQGSLAPDLQKDPDIALQTIRFLSLRGGHVEALRQLEAYRRETGVEDSRFDLLAADLMIRAGDHAGAAEKISALVREGGGTGASAFRLLELFPLESLRALPLAEILADLEEDAPIPPSDALVAAALRYARAADPAEAEAIVAATVAGHREDSLEALCLWLVRIGRRGETIPLISKEAAMASPTLAALRLQSHIVAQEFDEAERWLGEIERVFETARTHATRAVIAIRQDRRAEAQRSWRNAMADAGVRNNGNIYLRMGLMALEFGQGDWAVEAILKASAYPETLLPSGTEFTALIDYLLREDRLDEARKLAGLWLAREPENPVLRNNFIYLELLAGTPPEKALPQIEALAEAFPGMTGFQTTHALALALSGDPDGGLAILERPALDWSRASPSDRIILELLLRKSEAPATAATFLAGATLYPAERRLLEAFLDDAHAGLAPGVASPATEASDSAAGEP